MTLSDYETIIGAIAVNFVSSFFYIGSPLSTEFQCHVLFGSTFLVLSLYSLTEDIAVNHPYA